MRIFTNRWLFLLLNLFIALFFFFIFAPTYDLINIINALFYVCFIYLFLFLILFVMKGGFFDGITFGFRKFRANLSKDPDYLEEWKEKALPSEIINNTFYKTISFQGLMLLLIMLFLLCIFYTY